MKLVAFEDRNGHFIFVKVPGEFGRYVRTHMCVALAACGCGAAQGEPCFGQYKRYCGSVHVDRIERARANLLEVGINIRSEAKNGKPYPVQREDLIDEEDEPKVIKEKEPDIIDLREFFK